MWTICTVELQDMILFLPIRTLMEWLNCIHTCFFLFASCCMVLTSQETHMSAAFVNSHIVRTPVRNARIANSASQFLVKSSTVGENCFRHPKPSLLMIHRNGDSNPRLKKLRARALYFKDERSSEIFLDMPVELKKTRGTRQISRSPEPQSPEQRSEYPSITGESYWMEYTMRVACDVCEKKEDPAKPLQDLERQYLDGSLSAEEFEKKKQYAIKDFWTSLVSDGSIKRSIKTKKINLQVSYTFR